MPWELIIIGVAGVLLLGAGVRLIRQRFSEGGPVPDVGQPPEGAEPMVEPRMQDIGFASYELPLSEPDAEPDDSPD
jgi:hypothetical protein